MRIAIIVADFNAHITAALLEGAKNHLRQNGLEEREISVFHVAGSYEIPFVAKEIAETQKYNGIVALGCVIRGETVHFDYVCDAAAQGVMRVQLQTGIPIGFGVLMAENAEQALERAGGRVGNRGEEAARALLQVIQTVQVV